MLASLIVALIILVCVCGLIYYAPFIPAPIKQFAYFVVFAFVVLWVLSSSHLLHG